MTRRVPLRSPSPAEFPTSLQLSLRGPRYFAMPTFLSTTP